MDSKSKIFNPNDSTKINSNYMVDKDSGIIYSKKELGNEYKDNEFPEQIYVKGKYIKSSNLVNASLNNDINSIFKEDDEFVDLVKYLNNDYNILVKEISSKILEIENLNKLIATNNLDVEASRLVIIKLLSEKEELEQKILFFKDLIEVKNDDTEINFNNKQLKINNEPILLMTDEYKEIFKNKHSELVNSRKAKKNKSEISFKNIRSKKLCYYKFNENETKLIDTNCKLAMFTIDKNLKFVIVLMNNELYFYKIDIDLKSNVETLSFTNKFLLKIVNVRGIKILDNSCNSNNYKDVVVWNDKELLLYKLNVKNNDNNNNNVNSLIQLIENGNISNNFNSIIDIIEHPIKDTLIIISNLGWNLVKISNSSSSKVINF